MKVREAFTVARATTWSTDMPKPRNFDMQFGKSMTPVLGLLTFQSVENVSGQKPACMMRSTVSHLRWPVCPLPMSNQTPRRRAASTSGRMWPLSSMTLFGGGANMCVTISPRLSRLMSLGNGEIVWPIWIITGRLKDVATSCARRNTSKSLAPATRLDADDEVAVLRNRVLRRADVGASKVHRVAFGQDAGAPDVDQNAALLGRRLGDGNRVADVIGPLRSRVDPTRDAIREAKPRPACGSGGVGVDVDQPRDDELAACIDGFRGGGRDVGLDRRDAVSRDRHVADRVEPRRGIDDAAPLDDQIVIRRRRERVGRAGQHRSACGR